LSAGLWLDKNDRIIDIISVSVRFDLGCAKPVPTGLPFSLICRAVPFSAAVTHQVGWALVAESLTVFTEAFGLVPR
jgi:hypothetical protein